MQDWQAQAARLDCRFVPIVGAQTGGCVAAEMSIADSSPGGAAPLVEQARSEGAAAILAFAVTEQAIRRFAALAQPPTTRLLLSLAADLGAAQEWLAGPLQRSAAAHATARERLCLALPEPAALADCSVACALLDAARRAGFAIAIDQFGGTAAAFKLLLDVRPDIVRLEQKLVGGSVKDSLNRALIHHAVGFAHLIGTLVIADGVATPSQFMVVRDLDVDWVQGPLLAGEKAAAGELHPQYEIISELKRADRRERITGALPRDMIESLQPLPVTTPMTDVLEFFRSSGATGIATVVDDFDRPLGLIRERDLRDLVYSRFGGELLRNRTVGGRLRDFVVACPVIEADAQIGRLLDLFTRADASDGIIITRDQRYVGYLSAANLVRLAHERHVSLARDQNPLTKLPGNNLIAEHIESVVGEPGRTAHLVYFDFDSFKPFNDTLGFRQGDRAILMFADILQAAPIASRFIGHVGGDDFFLSLLDIDEQAAAEIVQALQAKFARDAESLYDAESRATGSIRAKDRDGRLRDFPLLSVSAVMATLPADRDALTPDQITRAIADAKGLAKANRFHHLSLSAPAPARALEQC